MSKNKDNEVKNNIEIFEKNKFTTKDGREWFCCVDDNKPIGEIKVTYYVDNYKLDYKGSMKGNLNDAYFDGYGELERSDGTILKGIFKNGQFFNGLKLYSKKNNQYNVKSFEGICNYNPDIIIKYYNGNINSYLKGKLIWNDGDFYNGTFSSKMENYNLFDVGIYKSGSLIEGKHQKIYEGSFFLTNNPKLKKGKKIFRELVDKDKIKKEDNIKILDIYEDCTFNESNKIIDGIHISIYSDRKWIYKWENGQKINTKLIFIRGKNENSSYEGKWSSRKTKEWIDNKLTEVDSIYSSFVEGTKILYINKKKRLIVKGNFDINCSSVNSNDCIEGDIEYIDICKNYYCSGKIEKSKLTKGKLLINENINYYQKLESLEGTFNGMGCFTKGKIVFKNKTQINGTFKYYWKNSSNSIIYKGKGEFFHSKLKEKDKWYNNKLFEPSIHSLVSKMIKNKYFTKKLNSALKKRGIKKRKEFEKYYIRILGLTGEWDKNEFVNGKITFTFLDGKAYRVKYSNNIFSPSVDSTVGSSVGSLVDNNLVDDCVNKAFDNSKKRNNNTIIKTEPKRFKKN